MNMSMTDRRTFLQYLSSSAFAAAYTGSIRRALAIPAHRRTGTLADVEHVVILMQENRSFDHYFGTLRGVRGFGDPRAVKLASGDAVWNQPDGAGGSVLPYHPTAPDLGLAYLVDTAHDWETTHAAWNRGKYDQWVPQKTPQTMAHYDRGDLPFHFALADAFTVCDAYYCSFLGPTDPNRYHMWTGWVGNDGQNGGPVLNNAEAGYDWSTYPEKLQAAGITWKIYQDKGDGLDGPNNWGWSDAHPYVGNYGDNSLLYFHQYQNAAPGSPLFVGARSGTDVEHEPGTTFFDQLEADVRGGRLPQVSWIVAPESYTEHGNWPPNFGAWYVSRMLDALTSNPDVWSKTAFFLTYDENDGFFDHMVPPTPPQSRAEGLSTIDTTNEVFGGNADFSAGPFGMGVRVPMIVISPWSKGGWVDSEVFDHTSLIQFIERRFGVREPNITKWRRAVAGDLTSAFDFASSSDAVVSLPSTDGFAPPDFVKHPDYVPAPPANQALPKQETGTRPARAVPYELHAAGHADADDGTFRIDFANTGLAAAVFQVRSGNDDAGPWTYTVGPHDKLSEKWSFAATHQTEYDLTVYGPNGFLRGFEGRLAAHGAALAVRTHYEPEQGVVVLEIQNGGDRLEKVRLRNVYTGARVARFLEPGETMVQRFTLEASRGWYDVTVEVDSDPRFRRRVAGHLETGRDGETDPAIGA
jgi:phospholipase C